MSNLKVILTVDQIKPPITGVGRYAYELAGELQALPGVETVRFFRGSRFTRDLVDDSPMRGRLYGALRMLGKSTTAVSLYKLLSPALKARGLWGFEDHLLHGTSFYLPPFRGRSIVTIHDLSPFSWPQCHPRERVSYMASEIKHTLRRASMLLTDSEFTRREVAAWSGWPLEKIRAVPLACSADFRPRMQNELRTPLLKWGLSGGAYCLFVGTIEPRKNLTGLLQAYERLPLGLRRRWPLILAGFSGWNSDDIHVRMARAVAEGWAKYLGYVAPEELPYLYSGARLFVFPSRYEGFGLPLLEAMASGVPVVCSNASSLPEISGGAAATCEPDDIETLSELIKIGLEDEAWRDAARVRGFARSSLFTWRRCAEETLSAYRFLTQT